MIELTNISKSYKMLGQTIFALNSVSLSIAIGEFVGIIGHSGSGKTTLMNILGCLDFQTAGSYLFDGVDIKSRTGSQISKIRNSDIGFIFQSFNLVPELSSLENVELPLIFRGTERAMRKKIAMQALSQVGLSSRAAHKPCELSGGQQQRVAVARAIASSPRLLLADEPTGNLDYASGKIVMDLLQALHSMGNTIILITHDPEIALIPNRQITIENGKII